MTDSFGRISKADSVLSSGSIASKLNLYGLSFRSKEKFLTMSMLKMSVSFLIKSFVSKIFQSIKTLLIPVFLILNVLVSGYELITIVGMGKVGGTVL